MTRPEERPKSAVRMPTLEELNYLWSEYRYRHELCWKAILKIAIAVVTLVALPYAQDDLTALLGNFMLLPAGVGAALAGFGILVVRNELQLFGKIKLAYRIAQNRLLEDMIGDRSIAQATMEVLSPTNTRSTAFDRYVQVFMWLMFLLSTTNVVLLGVKWIPYLKAQH